MISNYKKMVCFCSIATLLCGSVAANDQNEILDGLRSFYESYSHIHAEKVFADPEVQEKTRKFIRIDGDQSQLIEKIKGDELTHYNEVIALDDGIQLKVGFSLPKQAGSDLASGSLPKHKIRIRRQETDSDLRSHLTLLTGVIYGTDFTLLEILETGNNWQEKSVEVDGVACNEVKVEHEAGTFTVALAEELNWAPLQIRIEKTGAHKHKGELMSLDGISHYVKVFKYAKFDFEKRLFSLASQSKRTLVDDIEPEVHEFYRTWQITDLGSDQKISLGCKLPQGTQVTLGGRSQLSAVWNDGEIILPYDEQFCDQLKGSKRHFDNSNLTHSAGQQLYRYGLILLLSVFAIAGYIRGQKNDKAAP